MNPFRRLFLNKTVWMIVVFVGLLLGAFATSCRAEDLDDRKTFERSRSELHIEPGMAFIRGETPALMLRLEWPNAGPGDTGYECTLGIIGSADKSPNQGVWSCLLVDGYGRLDIGLGVAMLHHTDTFNGSRANYALMLRYRFTDRVSLTWRHYSNAGMTDVNKGRDLLLVGFMVAW